MANLSRRTRYRARRSDVPENYASDSQRRFCQRAAPQSRRGDRTRAPYVDLTSDECEAWWESTWRICRCHLRLTAEETASLTLRGFDLLTNEHLKLERRKEARLWSLVRGIAHAVVAGGQGELNPADLFPMLRDVPESEMDDEEEDPRAIMADVNSMLTRKPR